MSAEAKRAFCREWYARGVCPGCGAPLAKVTGRGERHLVSGALVADASVNGYRTAVAGDPTRINQGMRPDDKRLCRWNADDLTSLVLIATDFGRRTEPAVPLPPAGSVGRPDTDLTEGRDPGRPANEGGVA